MAYPPPNYETRPVKFNDSQDEFFRDDVNDARHNNDRASVLTGWTSGITVPYSEPRAANGLTHSQIIASEYSSRRESPIATLHEGGQPSYLTPGDRKSMGFDSTAISWVDSNFRYHSSRQDEPAPNESQDAPLVTNAAHIAKSSMERRDLEYAEAPYDARRGAKTGFFAKFLNQDRYPLEQRIEQRRRGIGRQKHPFVVYGLTLIMIAVFIYETVENNRATGAPFAFKPYVNPMIGPASIELVTLGGRFVPCMKLVPDVPLTLPIACANATVSPPPLEDLCTIEDICGFGGFKGKEPNQWFRFITPIFLHAGLIHLGFNMLAQYVLSGQVERDMGSVGFIILYFAAGIFGGVLGGNFALVGVPSVGASGAIFGTLAVMWVDLLAHWPIEIKPGRKLIGRIVELIIGFGLGYVPGVDNFAHLGGFLMGLVFGIILLPVISTTKRHKFIMWGLRIAMIPVGIILFVVLIRNFYTSDPSKACSWCRYLSCIPTAANNRCQGTGLTTTTTN